MEINFAQYFADTAALSAVVIAIVAFLKEHLLKSLDGVYTIVTSLVVGGVAGMAGSWFGYVDGGTVSGLAFGMSAGFLASGGWDAVKTMLGKR